MPLVQNLLLLAQNVTPPGPTALSGAGEMRFQYGPSGIETSLNGSAWTTILAEASGVVSLVAEAIRMPPDPATSPPAEFAWNQSAFLQADLSYDYISGWGWNGRDGYLQDVAGEHTMVWTIDSDFFTGVDHLISLALNVYDDVGGLHIPIYVPFDRGANEALAVQVSARRFQHNSDDLATLYISSDDTSCDFGRPVGLPSYTVAQANALLGVPAGAMVNITNEVIGYDVPAFYDGASWRRVIDGAVIA